MPNQLKLISVEVRGRAAVGEVRGSTHDFYEDRYRMLTMEAPLVQKADRGEVFAVIDGVGGAPKGMRAAETVADALIEFFEKSERWKVCPTEFETLLRETSRKIREWGLIEGTDRSLGAAVGTIAWRIDGDVLLFHAGDTEARILSAGTVRSVLPAEETGGAVIQYFGRGKDFALAKAEIAFGEADQLLLYTDGLRKCLQLGTIDAILKSGHSKEGIVLRLLEDAVRTGNAIDDVTAMVIDLKEDYDD